MAYLSGGGTLPDDETRPAMRAAGSRPWDRRFVVPATAADNGLFWTPEAVEEVQYPTRMARRRALEAAQILDGWQPDPVLTPPMLARVGDELLRLFHEPLDPDLARPGRLTRRPAQVADDEPAPVHLAAAPAGPRAHRRAAAPLGTAGAGRPWLSSRRPGRRRPGCLAARGAPGRPG